MKMSDKEREEFAKYKEEKVKRAQYNLRRRLKLEENNKRAIEHGVNITSDELDALVIAKS